MAGDPLRKGRYTNYSNKIGLFSNKTGNFISNSPEVVLNFPFKDTVLEAGMTKEDAGREERFLHIEMDAKDIDTLEDPKVLTNFKYIDQSGEHILDENSNIEFFDENGELKQNLLIKGNNLLALHTLKEKLSGKVKLIYIDPPYNTGNDGFRYNDSFNHSSWLTFMKNRLEVARELLRDDGLIFISCDNNEQAYLTLLMDEVFGKEKFVNTIAIRVSPPMGVKVAHATRTILKEKEYILIYCKNVSELNPQYTPIKKWDSHYNLFIENREEDLSRWKLVPLAKKLKELKMDKPNLGDTQFAKWLDNNLDAICQLIVPTNTIKNNRKYDAKKIQRVSESEVESYAYGGKTLFPISNLLHDTVDGRKISTLVCDLWTDIAFNNLFQEGGVDLKNGKKPEKLLCRIINLASKPGDIVLDYHLGSGTTAAVAHKMNRRWIGIEQMDYIETLSKKRLKNVVNGDQTGISKSVNWQGGGSFIYFELKKYNQDFIDRIMEAITIPELEEIYQDMQKNAFLKFFFDKKEFEKDENFRSLSLDERKQKLVDILDENQFYLNYAEMNDAKYHVSKTEKVLTDRFYQTNEESEDVEE